MIPYGHGVAVVTHDLEQKHVLARETQIKLAAGGRRQSRDEGAGHGFRER